MKITLLPLAVVLLSLALPLHAADGPAGTPSATPLASPSATPDKPKPFGGLVSAVTDSSITVSNRKLGDQTFKTDAGTKFIGPDRAVISLSDIKVGTRVRIKPGATPDVAARVTVVVPKDKQAPAASASATPAGSPAASPATPVATPIQ